MIPTTEALQRTWDEMRRRPCCRGWPESFDQVMADPVRGRLVRLEASHRPARPPAPPCPRPRPSSAPWPAAPPLSFDRKRAAAGERDED